MKRRSLKENMLRRLIPIVLQQLWLEVTFVETSFGTLQKGKSREEERKGREKMQILVLLCVF